jgi:hypothetical protein
MASIEIRPATAADAQAIAEIHYRALDTGLHEFYAAFFANHPRDILPRSTASALDDSSQTFLIAVDRSSGEPMGFIRYLLVEEESKEKKPDETTEAPGVDPPPPPQSLFAPKEHLKEVWARFNAREDEMEACYMSAAKGQRHNCAFTGLTEASFR